MWTQKSVVFTNKGQVVPPSLLFSLVCRMGIISARQEVGIFFLVFHFLMSYNIQGNFFFENIKKKIYSRSFWAHSDSQQETLLYLRVALFS